MLYVPDRSFPALFGLNNFTPPPRKKAILSLYRLRRTAQL
jgi:hypothetical protein